MTDEKQMEEGEVSNEKPAPGCLGYIGDYAAQLRRDYNQPLQPSLFNNHCNGKQENFVAQVENYTAPERPKDERMFHSNMSRVAFSFTQSAQMSMVKQSFCDFCSSSSSSCCHMYSMIIYV